MPNTTEKCRVLSTPGTQEPNITKDFFALIAEYDRGSKDLIQSACKSMVNEWTSAVVSM